MPPTSEIKVRGKAITDAIQVVVTSTLERGGWEIRSAEIDLVREEVVLSAHRTDGRWLYLRGGRGRVVVERFQRQEGLDTYRGGLTVDVVRDEFLGRDTFDGPRVALRYMCNYIADNPAPGKHALPASTVRNAIRLLMGSD